MRQKFRKIDGKRFKKYLKKKPLANDVKVKKKIWKRAKKN